MEQWQPRLTARRIVRSEYDQIRQMYQQMGRDGEWLTEMSIDEMDDAGDWWGLYCEEELVLCCSVARPDRSVMQIRALCGAQKTLDKRYCMGTQYFWLPPAFSEQAGAFAGAFYGFLQRRYEGKGIAALAVKTGALLLHAFFASRFQLIAVRPLQSLRPHYLFAQTRFPFSAECRIIRESETLELSRALENGGVGVGLFYRDKSRGICIAPVSRPPKQEGEL